MTQEVFDPKELLQPNGPICMVIKAFFEPVGGLDRFQPAGFPEVGHVIYEAPRPGGNTEKVCIVDSPASMANHLEAVCLAERVGFELHSDLKGLPYVCCVTDRDDQIVGNRIEIREGGSHDRVVATTFTEGHRLASDYFLEGTIGNGSVSQRLREKLRQEFRLTEVKKDKVYFLSPEDWWSVFSTIFKYDPNSLVHGLMFAREQIKIPRFLTGHLEAFGAARVGRSGVKFDRLGKTTSGQPIFAVDEETANKIRATFILDLALLRSFGSQVSREGKPQTVGLNLSQKELILLLALWKINRLLSQPYRFRTGCHLECKSLEITPSIKGLKLGNNSPGFNIGEAVKACEFSKHPVIHVYYPAEELFKPGKEEKADQPEMGEESEE
ncbi:MAG: type I-U CRISPR-associated protein Cas7 [Thermodesulfobacteriota bacterium]